MMQLPVWVAEALVFQCPRCRKEHFVVCHTVGKHHAMEMFYNEQLCGKELFDTGFFTKDEVKAMMSGYCPECIKAIEPKELTPYQVAKLFNEAESFIDGCVEYVPAGCDTLHYNVDIPSELTDEQRKYLISQNIDVNDEMFTIDADIVEAVKEYLEDVQNG